MSGWQPIETAPKDGTVVDLWIIGGTDDVDFYAPLAKKRKGAPIREGRAPDFQWMEKKPNPPNWYPVGGLGYPLSPEVEATHWMPHPEAPR